MADKKAEARKGAIMTIGHEECRKELDAYLAEFGLPLGLLPVQDIVELGFVKDTGYIWLVQKKRVEHTFKLISKLVSYDTEVSGYLSKEHVKKCSGVKAKELLIWAPVGDISLNRQDKARIHFKSFGGISKTFDVKAFAEGQ